MALDPYISTSVLTLEQLFSGTYRFRLPWLQRAYAWSDLHVGRLIDDVHAASRGPKRRYSLGHVFLAKPGDGPETSLIDGHQRSITLTMLFALLRDLLPPGPLVDRLHGLIEVAGAGGFHLTPQPSLAPFFEAFVQHRQSSLVEPDGDIMDRSESERNLLANRNHMRGKIEQMMPGVAEREAFAAFLLHHCYVIVEVVEDEEEAWSLQTIGEETGLERHSSERAKLSLVMEMPRAEQEMAGRTYEQAQAIVGPDGMWKLLFYIRTLRVRRRTSKPVENDLKALFKLDKSGLLFLQEELLPRAEAMMHIKNRTVGTGPSREVTKHALEMLSWIDHEFWVPSALLWLQNRKADNPETPLFFNRLDRLVYLLKIAGVDPTDQEKRLLALLGEIDASAQLAVDDMPQLAIARRLLTAALDNLRSSTFYSKRFHGLVLRRISRLLAPTRNCPAVDGRFVTVEHILPRKPPKDRRWWQDFKSQAQITEYCNRIGNLTFLSNEENRVADTNDYVLKRPILQEASARFVLAEHAAANATWTPEVIDARSEALIATLMAPWELPTR